MHTVTQEYFSIQHNLSVNIVPVDEALVPKDQHALELEMPMPFRMANDVADIDATALRSIRLLGEQAEALTDFLLMQNEKINLILGYVLEQQDDPAHSYTTTAFSAGELSINSEQHFKLNQIVRIKIFLPAESTAIYCYGHVSGIMDINDSTEQNYTLSYDCIREIDREILIRSTLRIQQQQLKQRAELRQQNTSQHSE